MQGEDFDLKDIKLLTMQELVKIVPYVPQHIRRLEKAGQFPKHVKIGANRIAWLEVEVKNWLQERIARRG